MEIRSAPSVAYVTSSGRDWRKVPESDARSMGWPYSGVTNSGRIWRKARSVDAGIKIVKQLERCFIIKKIKKILLLHYRDKQRRNGAGTKQLNFS